MRKESLNQKNKTEKIKIKPKLLKRQEFLLSLHEFYVLLVLG